jgi:hypothetical protein
LAKWPLRGAPTLRPFHQVFNTMALNLGPSLQMEEKGKDNNEAQVIAQRVEVGSRSSS